MKPHPLFRIWRPDEVAECLDGVGNTPLYGKLWTFIPLYKGKRPEEAEEPTPGTDSLSKFWKRLTDEEKTTLNQLAKAYDEKWK